MKKNDLIKQLHNAGVDAATLEIRLFIPSANELLYMQVGDGSQLDDEDCDEDDVPYDNYIDYTEYDWDGNEFDEIDGGIFAYHTTKEDSSFGELAAHMYATLCFIYDEETVENKNFTVQLLVEKEL